MSTYSAHRGMTGSDHPLNGGLGGYCRGNLPRVSWAAGYDPKSLGYNYFPPAANGWGTTHPVLENDPTNQG
jgi:hypothetical protein